MFFKKNVIFLNISKNYILHIKSEKSDSFRKIIIQF